MYICNKQNHSKSLIKIHSIKNPTQNYNPDHHHHHNPSSPVPFPPRNPPNKTNGFLATDNKNTQNKTDTIKRNNLNEMTVQLIIYE